MHVDQETSMWTIKLFNLCGVNPVGTNYYHNECFFRLTLLGTKSNLFGIP